MGIEWQDGVGVDQKFGFDTDGGCFILSILCIHVRFTFCFQQRMRKVAADGGANMDEQDRQDGNYLVLERDLFSTRCVAQDSPTIVDR